MTASITATKIGFEYPKADAPVFQELTFSIQAGNLVALGGPSGSGKSTLLSILGGATKPTAGTINFVETDPIQWVFQNPHGPAHRTTIDIAGMPALARGAYRREAEFAARAALEDVALAHRASAPFHTLSGGEAQRLMLARAVVAEPSLLLVDEPTAQLDRASATTVIRVLRKIGATQRLVVIATHDPRVIEQCDTQIELGTR